MTDLWNGYKPKHTQNEIEHIARIKAINKNTFSNNIYSNFKPVKVYRFYYASPAYYPNLENKDRLHVVEDWTYSHQAYFSNGDIRISNGIYECINTKDDVVDFLTRLKDHQERILTKTTKELTSSINALNELINDNAPKLSKDEILIKALKDGVYIYALNNRHFKVDAYLANTDELVISTPNREPLMVHLDSYLNTWSFKAK